jgi:uncharacterized protein YjbI with pentapeptide repeats
MKIAEPDLPSVLKPIDSNDFVSHAEHSGIVASEIDLAGKLVPNLTLWESLLDRVVLSSTKLQKLFAKEVVVHDCDLTAAKCPEATLAQVQFTKCRMDGVDLSGADLRDIVFTGCKLDLANFRQSTLKRVRFVDCSLKETDFLNAKLNEVEFSGCIIERTCFDQVTAKKVDLSGSELISLVGWQSLKGVTIDQLQLISASAQIVTALGIIVKESD